MLSVLYLSSASIPYSDDDLAALLTTSRENNARLGLTGILLYRNGQFMQVLEGPEDAVNARFAVIAADPRHRGVQKLVTDSIAERQFPSWAMGFRPLTDTLVKQIPGYDDFFEAPQSERSLPETATRARLLLEWFRVDRR